jgi:hypothetical protein
MSPFDSDQLDYITLRWACADDRDAVAALAALDSRPVPAGRVLLAEVDGTLRAAATAEGAVLADPFVPTEHVVHLLRARLTSARSPRSPVGRVLTRRWASAL